MFHRTNRLLELLESEVRKLIDAECGTPVLLLPIQAVDGLEIGVEHAQSARLLSRIADVELVSI
jgi:hypothetical protein